MDSVCRPDRLEDRLADGDDAAVGPPGPASERPSGPWLADDSGTAVGPCPPPDDLADGVEPPGDDEQPPGEEAERLAAAALLDALD